MRHRELKLQEIAVFQRTAANYRPKR